MMHREQADKNLPCGLLVNRLYPSANQPRLVHENGKEALSPREKLG